MDLTYLGHSCFLLVSGEVRVVVDPFISSNPLADGIDVDSLQPTHVLLTHGHEDHVADAESLLRSSGAELIAPYEVATWFGAKGVERVCPINPGADLEIKHGPSTCKLRVVGAVHSSTLPDGTPGGVACGYILDDGGVRVFHAGDTDLSMDMELIGRHWTPDWSILPIGGTFTMGYADVPVAMQMLKCRNVVGMHYDTFPPISIDKEKAVRTVEEAGGALLLPEVGKGFKMKKDHG